MLMVGYLTRPSSGDVAEEIGCMLRVTARISLLFASVARPTTVLLGNIDPLRTGVRQYIRHRRYLRLAMAVTHTVHAGYIAALPLILGLLVRAFQAREIITAELACYPIFGLDFCRYR